MKSEQRALSQLYTYGNFEYYTKGTLAILKGGAPIQHFYALSTEIDRINLAAYLCDVAGELSDEGQEAGELLQLLLNSLYAVSRDLYPQELIKGAFEMRVAAISGYLPDLGACGRCGACAEQNYYLDVMNGALLCEDCLHQKKEHRCSTESDYCEIREAEVISLLTPAVRAALQYCVHAPMKRIFSFDLKEREDSMLFAKAAQTYLLSHLGHGFDSLQFYHTMREETPFLNKGTEL